MLQIEQIGPVTAKPGDQPGVISFTVPARACPGDFTGASASLSYFNMIGDKLTATAATPLQILDVEAPRFDLDLSPEILWPPDRKLRKVVARIRTKDNCDRHPAVTLVSITSNEPDSHHHDHDRDHRRDDNDDRDDDHDRGRGPDIQGAKFGTDDRVFYLRAERETGRRDHGRVYTVTYRVTDDYGNVTTRTATVTVPIRRHGGGH